MGNYGVIRKGLSGVAHAARGGDPMSVKK